MALDSPFLGVQDWKVSKFSLLMPTMVAPRGSYATTPKHSVGHFRTTAIYDGKIPLRKNNTLYWSALFSIQQTDLTSFSEDRRGVKWL
jgi:hypothetical protein